MGVTNDIFEKEDKHYITIYMKANYKLGDVKNMEPTKHLEVKWFKMNELPENITITTKKAMEFLGKTLKNIR
jgi:ADP-ribose pyrophosphatase YjhB (NUDIX family)